MSILYSNDYYSVTISTPVKGQIVGSYDIKNLLTGVVEAQASSLPDAIDYALSCGESLVEFLGPIENVKTFFRGH